MHLSVREIEEADFDLVADYWLHSDAEFMKGMGVDISKIPRREEWHEMLGQQVKQSYTEKQSYCLVWLLDDIPVGHSNINKIVFGDLAYMHLHLWNSKHRRSGYGTRFVKLCLPLFFRNMQLKTIFSEPAAFNSGPNKTLEKAGFQFIKKYTCTPGWINTEQEVNLWKISL
jgi:RimJ/RimL family protein N-acetyltransferase